MKWFLQSKMFVFNLIVLGVAMFTPGIVENIRIVVITIALTNLGLRTRTKEAVYFLPRKDFGNDTSTIR